VFKGQQLADDAVVIAHAAANYAKALDNGVRSASVAKADAMAKPVPLQPMEECDGDCVALKNALTSAAADTAMTVASKLKDVAAQQVAKVHAAAMANASAAQ